VLHRSIRPALSLAAITALCGSAAAQPKFEYGKADEVKDVKAVEWKASAQAGLIVTSGNSRTTTGAVGASASRKAGHDKFSAEAGAAYARADITVGVDANMNGALSRDEIQTITTTTTRAWLAKARYDRFLTEHNSLYLSAGVTADQPAGKQLFGGAQLGYSRLLYKSDRHELATEAGYDFTYENYVAPGDPVNIHSARGFAGYTGKVRTDTEVSGATEVLVNLNSEDTPTGTVKAGRDVRVNGKAAVTTKLTSILSLRVGFTLKYDRAPAPRPQIGGLPFDGFTPLAKRLDTITELQLVVTLL